MTNGIWNFINGVWRRVSQTHVKVNGVWRNADVSINVNNIWRQSHKYELTDDDILGFRLIYSFDSDAHYPLLPHLKPTRDLPIRVDAAGDLYFDFGIKSIKYHYFTEDIKVDQVEGLGLYRGRLYAVISTGQLVEVSCFENEIGSVDTRHPSNLPGITETWRLANLMEAMNIQIYGYIITANNGEFYGWNEFFDTDSMSNFFPMDIHTCEPRIIYPPSKRNSTYDSVASIGIARNLSKPDYNMLGSDGTIDHVIWMIRLNGVSKPFSVEIL